jgi:hypothetical protein
MIEVFSCKEDIEIRAGSNHSKFEADGDGVLRMEHANYGGHYVISAENLTGEYYLQTVPVSSAIKNYSGMSYVISYYHYDTSLGEKMPYRVYGIQDTTIQYAYKSGAVQFKLNKIYRKDSLTTVGTTLYTLYISTTSDDIMQTTACSLGNPFAAATTNVGDVIESANMGEYVVFELKVHSRRCRMK